MAEAVDGCDEVVLRLGGRIAHDELVEHGIVGIGKEHRFDVGIVHTYMFHAVFLLVTTCQLVLLDVALLIVVGMGAHYQTVLRLALHGLCIYIIMFLRILHQPALVLELLEVLGGLLIDAGIVLRSTYGEVDFRFDDVISARASSESSTS